jgi:hypothetical protein
MTRLTLTEIADRATISVPEAGQLLEIGRDAAYAAAGNGQIPTLRLGRSLRVPVPKLLELLGAQGPEDSEAAVTTRGTSPMTPTPTKRFGHPDDS